MRGVPWVLRALVAVVGILVASLEVISVGEHLAVN
jgi:hypothetical protein